MVHEKKQGAAGAQTGRTGVAGPVTAVSGRESSPAPFCVNVLSDVGVMLARLPGPTAGPGETGDGSLQPGQGRERLSRTFNTILYKQPFHHRCRGDLRVCPGEIQDRHVGPSDALGDLF